MNYVLTNGVPNGGLPPPTAVLPPTAAGPATPMALQRPLISPGKFFVYLMSCHTEASFQQGSLFDHPACFSNFLAKTFISRTHKY